MKVTELGGGLVYVDMDDEADADAETVSLLPALDELMDDLRRAGILKSEFDPKGIKALREREKATRGALARLIGVSIATVAGWERGRSVPSGPALRLLELADRKGLDAIR